MRCKFYASFNKNKSLFDKATLFCLRFVNTGDFGQLSSAREQKTGWSEARFTCMTFRNQLFETVVAVLCLGTLWPLLLPLR